MISERARQLFVFTVRRRDALAVYDLEVVVAKNSCLCRPIELDKADDHNGREFKRTRHHVLHFWRILDCLKFSSSPIGLSGAAVYSKSNSVSFHINVAPTR